MVKRFLESDAATVDAVAKSGELAVRIRDALMEGDLELVGALIGEDWQARRAMAPAVSSPELEALMGACIGAGASSARVCGAGGGGCMLVNCPPGTRDDVEAAVRKAGGSVLDYAPVDHGMRLLLSEED